MGVQTRNNAVSQLAGSLTEAATTITVAAGTGSLFPAIGAGQWFPLTLVKNTGAREIVRCTARSGDVMTVTRAQEGTEALAFAVGDIVSLRVTAALLDEFMQTDEFSTFVHGLLLLANSEEFRNALELGNAAVKTVQTSALDKTTGRVLTFGAFGLGVSVSMPADTNLNAVVDSGFYRLGSGVTNGPGFTVDYGELIVAKGGDTILQIVADYLGRMAFRAGNPAEAGGSGVYSGWREVYHTGNLPLAELSPPGSVMAFAGPNAPAGWLKCNGAAISRSTYSGLFANIGTWFGGGDGSTTFNIPDLRGEFIRGWDDGRGVDGSRPFASFQQDALQQITGSFSGYHTNGFSVSGAFDRTIESGGRGAHSEDQKYTITFDSARVARSAAETRPRNVAMNFCIRY